MAKYPELAKLQSLAVAVNGAYAQNEAHISAEDEVVLIPPVSGG
jgi:molybdopterin synthase sulfur carrier subunit